MTLEERQGFSAIRRLDGKTIVSVTADLDTDVLTTTQAIEQLKDAGLAELTGKYAIDYKFGGRNEEREKSFADLSFGVVIALSVIYIILAWVFSSYFLPIAIMLIVPFGIVGAIFGHWLLGYKLTILSFIALLGLTGILVNDFIILVSRMIERMKDKGEQLLEAATGASRDRLRAVLLTSLTTIGGLIPLMFEKSSASPIHSANGGDHRVSRPGRGDLVVPFLVPGICRSRRRYQDGLPIVFLRRARRPDKVTAPAEYA